MFKIQNQERLLEDDHNENFNYEFSLLISKIKPLFAKDFALIIKDYFNELKFFIKHKDQMNEESLKTFEEI